MTRTQAILEEIRKALAERQSVIDGATDLAEVTISVKLQVGTNTARGVKWEEERVRRL